MERKELKIEAHHVVPQELWPGITPSRYCPAARCATEVFGKPMRASSTSIHPDDDLADFWVPDADLEAAIDVYDRTGEFKLGTYYIIRDHANKSRRAPE